MISRRTRRATSPVENLKQSGFNAVKGIDISKPLVDTSTVAYSKNLDIDTDGSLVLRKPIIYSKEVPDVILKDGRSLPTRLVCCTRTFDKTCTLVIRQGLGTYEDSSFIAILDSEDYTVSKYFHLKYFEWDTYKKISPVLPNSVPALHKDSPYRSFSAINLANVSVANTSSSTVLTNAEVDVCSSAFPSICNDILYDVPSGNPLHKPRTLIISKSSSPLYPFDLTIVTPAVNELSSSETLTLNPNLDLDNAYSLRDNYSSAAPNVKGVLPYIHGYFTDGGQFTPDSLFTSETKQSAQTLTNSNSRRTEITDSDLQTFIPNSTRPLKVNAVKSENSSNLRYVTLTFSNSNWGYDPKFETWFPRVNSFTGNLKISIPICVRGVNGPSLKDTVMVLNVHSNLDLHVTDDNLVFVQTRSDVCIAGVWVPAGSTSYPVLDSLLKDFCVTINTNPVNARKVLIAVIKEYLNKNKIQDVHLTNVLEDALGTSFPDGTTDATLIVFGCAKVPDSYVETGEYGESLGSDNYLHSTSLNLSMEITCNSDGNPNIRFDATADDTDFISVLNTYFEFI